MAPTILMKRISTSRWRTLPFCRMSSARRFEDCDGAGWPNVSACLPTHLQKKDSCGSPAPAHEGRHLAAGCMPPASGDPVHARLLPSQDGDPHGGIGRSSSCFLSHRPFYGRAGGRIMGMKRHAEPAGFRVRLRQAGRHDAEDRRARRKKAGAHGARRPAHTAQEGRRARRTTGNTQGS